MEPFLQSLSRCTNAEKFKTDSDKKLVGVYIDITGNKEIYKRPEMVQLYTCGPFTAPSSG